jgi:hypothetical protein
VSPPLIAVAGSKRVSFEETVYVPVGTVIDVLPAAPTWA